MKMTKTVFLLLLIVLLPVAMGPPFIPNLRADWLTGWSDRKSHTLNGAGEAVEDYQIQVNVYYGSGTDNGPNVYCNEICQVDFDDIRFTDDDGITLLPHWREIYSTATSAVFWVKVPSIPSSGSTTIYLYYGNDAAPSASDIDETFIFGDDFDSDPATSGKWGTVTPYDDDRGSGSVSSSIVSGGNGNRWKVHATSTMDIAGYRLEEQFPSTGNFMIQASGEWNFADHHRGGQFFLACFYSEDLASQSGSRWGYGCYLWGDYHEAYRRYIDESSGGPVNLPDHTSGSELFWCGRDEDGTSDYYYMQMDGTYDLTSTGTSTGYATGGYVRLESMTDYWSNPVDLTAWWDWVFVRNYVDPEPTHGAWGDLPQPTGEPAEYFDELQSESCTIKYGSGEPDDHYKTWSDDSYRHWLSTVVDYSYEPVDVEYTFHSDESIDQEVYKLQINAKAKAVSGTAYLYIYDFDVEGWVLALTFGGTETLESKTYTTNFYRFISDTNHLKLRWILTGINNFLAINYQQISLMRCLDDLGALDCINAYEMRLQFSASELHASMFAIIDSGLDPDVFLKIRENLGAEGSQLQIERYIKFWKEDNDWHDDDITSGMLKSSGDPDAWIDETKHGTKVFSTAAQIAKTGHFVILDVPNYASTTPESVEALQKALEWLRVNDYSNNQLVVSISLGWSPEIPDMNPPGNALANLHLEIQTQYALGVTICASSGNYREDYPNAEFFPADWDEVISVGAVYDYDTQDDYERGDLCVFSSRGDTLFLCAPGYQIQSYSCESTGYQGYEADVFFKTWTGTSASCPIVAAAISVILHHNNEKYLTYLLEYGSGVNSVRFQQLLQNTAQNTPSGEFPDINQNPPLPREDYDPDDRGYGIFDFYDAFMTVIYPS